MSSEQYILTIDLGTSGPKIALINLNAEIVSNHFEAVDIILFDGDGAEQDPALWWEAICKGIRHVLSNSGIHPEKILAISTTSQWSGTVVVDKQGEHLMNAIIWRDSRGAVHSRQITSGWPSVEGYGLFKLLQWLHLTGGIPTHSGSDSISHILFIKNELPGIYRDSYKFLEPKDYINLKLSGKFAASYDSIALYWLTDNRNISKVEYSPFLLKRCGIRREKLPDLFPATHILGPIRGDLAESLGLSADTKVIMGTPDVHSAAIGSGAVKDYASHLYIGTSSWLTCHVPFKKTDISHNMASLPSALPGKYLVANEQESAGSCLNFLRDKIFFHDDELNTDLKPPENILRKFDLIAERIPAGSGQMIFLPWLYGERTPIDDHSVRGGFFNQSLDTNRSHMIRAVMEGVAYNSRWLKVYLEKFIKRKISSISIIGGGAKSDVWCQIFADVMDCEIRKMADPIHSNSLGAAFLGAIALDKIKVENIPSLVRVEKTFQPQADNRKIYDELFREFVNIYNSNRKIYARLNRIKTNSESN